jgi:hypothetical protein
MTIESLAVVESSMTPWRCGPAWPDDISTIVSAELGGICIDERALQRGCDVRAVVDAAESGLRVTTCEPEQPWLLAALDGDALAGAAHICHSVRRFAPFAPTAVAFGVMQESSEDLSRRDDVASGIQLVARTAALLHQHACGVALLSSSVGCSASRLLTLVREVGESNLRVVVEASRLRSRDELDFWAAHVELIATVRLRVRVEPDAAVTPLFDAPDLDLATTAATLTAAGYRPFGFYEVELVDGGAMDGSALALLASVRTVVRGAVRPHLIGSTQPEGGDL